MLFAIVACNQSGPEVKPDAFEEANQAIPSSNVDMTTAQDVTENQTVVEAFNEDFAKAQTQVMSGVVGVIMESTSAEGQVDWGKVLAYYLGGTVRTLDDGAADSDSEPTVKVDIDSMSGVLSLECDELVFKGSEIGEDGNPITVEHVLSNIVVDATLSEKTISITVKGSLNDEAFEISGTITLDTYAKDEEDQIVVNFPSEDSAVLATIKGIISDYSLAGSKDIILTLTDVKAGLSVTVKGVATIPVEASLNGNIVLSIAMNEKDEISGIAVKVNSLTAKVDAGALGNVSASIKNLSFKLDVGLSISLSVSEVSLSGTLLPNNDNIRLKANMKDFEFDSTGIIAIESMEATVLGYKNISIAAKVESFRANTSADEVLPSFRFGAAVSFENQAIGVRGEMYDLKPFKLITTLNGSPVTKDSLIALIGGAVNPTPDGDDRV